MVVEDEPDEPAVEVVIKIKCILLSTRDIVRMYFDVAFFHRVLVVEGSRDHPLVQTIVTGVCHLISVVIE